MWGAYLGLIPPFVWPFLCYCRQGCAGCTEKTNYYIDYDEYGNGTYILVKDRDTIEFGFGYGQCGGPCVECKRYEEYEDFDEEYGYFDDHR